MLPKFELVPIRTYFMMFAYVRRLVGPGWGGLYGSTVKLADGSSVVANEDYLAESILKPDAKIVQGFEPGAMPSFAEVLDTAQVNDIVAYIRSLEGRKP